MIRIRFSISLRFVTAFVAGISAAQDVIAQERTLEYPLDATEITCNCVIYPWKPQPPCVSVCSAKAAQTAPKEWLSENLGLSPGQIESLLQSRDVDKWEENLADYCQYNSENCELIRSRIQDVETSELEVLGIETVPIERSTW